jgi:hypothetical protein
MHIFIFHWQISHFGTRTSASYIDNEQLINGKGHFFLANQVTLHHQHVSLSLWTKKNESKRASLRQYVIFWGSSLFVPFCTASVSVCYFLTQKECSHREQYNNPPYLILFVVVNGL